MRFGARASELIVKNGRVSGVRCADGAVAEARRDFKGAVALIEKILGRSRGGETDEAANDRVFLVHLGMAYQQLGRNDIEPEVSGQFRAGDIRHCFADIAAAKRLLGY